VTYARQKHSRSIAQIESSRACISRSPTRWAELYFSRNRFTIERDQTQSLYFLNSDVQRAVIDQERKDNSIQNYIKDSTLPYVDVEIKNVILDDLDSLRIRRASSSRRFTRTPRIITNSSGSDGQPASPMSFART